jgi:phage tail protein X
MDQRCVVLHVTSRTAGAVEATGPADGTVAPLGPYLLFAVKVKGQDVPANRIPSTGQFVMVGP